MVFLRLSYTQGSHCDSRASESIGNHVVEREGVVDSYGVDGSGAHNSCSGYECFLTGDVDGTVSVVRRG